MASFDDIIDLDYTAWGAATRQNLTCSNKSISKESDLNRIC